MDGPMDTSHEIWIRCHQIPAWYWLAFSLFQVWEAKLMHGCFTSKRSGLCWQGFLGRWFIGCCLPLPSLGCVAWLGRFWGYSVQNLNYPLSSWKKRCGTFCELLSISEMKVICSLGFKKGACLALKRHEMKLWQGQSGSQGCQMKNEESV